MAQEFLSDDIWEKIQEHEKKEKLRITQFGEVREPIVVDFHGYKMVVAGNRIHYAPASKWKTVPDFLFEYLPMTLGKEWGQVELSKPYEKQHPIVQWRIKAIEYMRQEARKGQNPKGFYETIPNGYMAAFLALAYDLHVVHDNGRLDEELLRRLKHVDQFQGARHELFAEATCLRAGFTIEHEDEKDRTKRHAEFTAIHKQTGQKVSVEAKSKHRPGVLGRPGSPELEDEVNLRFGALINDAINKKPPYPLVIFLDTNLPPVVAEQFFRPLLMNPHAPPILMQKLIDRVQKEHEGWDPYNLLVLTNHPHHYGKEDEADPRKHILSVMPLKPIKQVQYPVSVFNIHRGAEKYGNIPNEFSKQE